MIACCLYRLWKIVKKMRRRNSMSTPIVVQQSSPNIVVRFLYFIFIGWWLGLLVSVSRLGDKLDRNRPSTWTLSYQSLADHDDAPTAKPVAVRWKCAKSGSGAAPVLAPSFILRGRGMVAKRDLDGCWLPVHIHRDWTATSILDVWAGCCGDHTAEAVALWHRQLALSTHRKKAPGRVCNCQRAPTPLTPARKGCWRAPLPP